MTQPIQHHLDAGDFLLAKNNARQVLARIKAKYPTLKAWVVLAMTPAQCDLDASPEAMLKECPALLVDGPAKSQLRNLPPLPKEPDQAARTSRARMADELAGKLLYRSDCRIELRFGHLDYPRLWELKQDEWVDRTLTSESRASIRVVLGTLGDFVKGRA